ncbi:unnamed protein product, partial [Porites evermanni]
MNTLKHRCYYQALVSKHTSLKRDLCYNLRGKGSNLVQPHFNTESFSFIASKLWNKLPL